ncbi:hypothetical protein Golomagni_03226 [Golovinomyces magnicellulatus]|nr:hypothetical protein Golomagni_03226 [Golovinomyces magnicellulatus]
MKTVSNMLIYYFLLFVFSPFTFAAYLQPFIRSLPSDTVASKLPPSTHATLTTLSQTYSAPLSTRGNFNFKNVSSGSYLLEVYCHSFSFAPLRVDVREEGYSLDDLEYVQVWNTFRGNEWENKGEIVNVIKEEEGTSKRYSFEVQLLATKKYIMERPGFSPLNMLKNPMILMAILTMVVVFGMPYLMDNLDPELKAEFNEAQKPSSTSSSAPNPLQNFDAAAWLAGSGKGVAET